MNPLLKCLVLALAVSAAPLAAAHAAQFEVIYKSCPEDFGKYKELAKAPPKTNCKGSADRLINGVMVLRLAGDIAPGDADHLQDFLETQIRSVSGYGYDGDGTMVTVEMVGRRRQFRRRHRARHFLRRQSGADAHPAAARPAPAPARSPSWAARDWTRFSREAIDRRLEAGGQLDLPLAALSVRRRRCG